MMSASLRRALTQLSRQLPAGEILLDDATLKRFSGDKWFATARPDAAALASSTKSVSTILAFAHEHRIPVTPRGAGHGYVGGCVPVQGGIVLSVEKMNRILEVNDRDFVAVVQPGVITATLQKAVEKKRLFYPPDPASRADCSLGGNIATNAGGPRCLKYGVTRDYVLGLEVVLADGTITRLGGRAHKNKTGFDLHRLFVGSEGMLGIVTEATLKLLPLPPYRALLGVGFDTMRGCTRAIREIFKAGFLPCALEMADQFTLAAARKRTGSKRLEGANAKTVDFIQRAAADIVSFQLLLGWRKQAELTKGRYTFAALDAYLYGPLRALLFAAEINGKGPQPAICGESSELIVQAIQVTYRSCPSGGGIVSDEVLALFPKGVESSWNGAPWTAASHSCSAGK